MRDRHLTLLPEPLYPGVNPARTPQDVGILPSDGEQFSIQDRIARERLEASKRSIEIYKGTMRAQKRTKAVEAKESWRPAEQILLEEARRIFVPSLSHFDEPAAISRRSLLATQKRKNERQPQVPLIKELVALRPGPLSLPFPADEDVKEEQVKTFDELFSLDLKIPTEHVLVVKNLMAQARSASRWRPVAGEPLLDLELPQEHSSGEDTLATPLSPPLIPRSRNKGNAASRDVHNVPGLLSDVLSEAFSQHLQLEAPRQNLPPPLPVGGRGSLDESHSFLDLKLEGPSTGTSGQYEALPARTYPPVRIQSDLFDASEDRPLTRIHRSTTSTSDSTADLISSLTDSEPRAPLNLDDSTLPKLSVGWGSASKTKSGCLDLEEKLETMGNILRFEVPRLSVSPPKPARHDQRGSLLPTDLSLTHLVGSSRVTSQSCPLQPLPGLRSLNIDLGERWWRGPRTGPHSNGGPWPFGEQRELLGSSEAAERMIEDINNKIEHQRHTTQANFVLPRRPATPIGLVEDEEPLKKRVSEYEDNEAPRWATTPGQPDESSLEAKAQLPAENESQDELRTPSPVVEAKEEEGSDIFDWQQWEDDAVASQLIAVAAVEREMSKTISREDAPHRPVSTLAELPPKDHERREDHPAAFPIFFGQQVEQGGPSSIDPEATTLRQAQTQSTAGQAVATSRAALDMTSGHRWPSTTRRWSPCSTAAQPIEKGPASRPTILEVLEEAAEPSSQPADAGEEAHGQSEHGKNLTMPQRRARERNDDALEQAIKRAKLNSSASVAMLSIPPKTATTKATVASLDPMDIFMRAKGIPRASPDDEVDTEGSTTFIAAAAKKRQRPSPTSHASGSIQSPSPVHQHEDELIFQPPNLDAPLPSAQYFVTLRGLQHHSVLSALQDSRLSVQLVEQDCPAGQEESLLPHLILPASMHRASKGFVLLFKLTLLPSAMRDSGPPIPPYLDLRCTLESLLPRHYQSGLILLEGWNSDSGNPLPASLLATEKDFGTPTPISKARGALDDWLRQKGWTELVQVKVARSPVEAAWGIRGWDDGRQWG
ncbi:hypothetical protein BDZ90DRAFT_232960 [Jaminaea rosea]|uniref:Uncharacterized protein n=1 Tax=Jaminaea rosea TaxID=1569628 RepID=A0A316UUS3_9BASI|nr:hypothetical protein BDZ90DRAFT_232960 [Jaminaea rosea]PWN26865.1 hypothetical protein BDZ90DRAFT_232960 [Jaminaea rosea]